jgi:hypothetical protein
MNADKRRFRMTRFDLSSYFLASTLVPFSDRVEAPKKARGIR